jgi:hypothetical protein
MPVLHDSATPINSSYVEDIEDKHVIFPNIFHWPTPDPFFSGYPMKTDAIASMEADFKKRLEKKRNTKVDINVLDERLFRHLLRMTDFV